MTWIPLLLSDPSPNLRILVLKDLLHRPDDDDEIIELMKIRESDPLIKSFLKTQLSDGSWSAIDIGDVRGTSGNLQATSQALVRLGYLGFNTSNDSINRAVDYIFSKQKNDGSWPIPKRKVRHGEEISNYDMMPLQTAIPLEGIAACGLATDKRTEKAYEWLIKQRLDDGAWPTGTASGVYGGVGGYRRIPQSKWGCRSSTIAVLNCFSYHPKRRRSPEAKKALDLILGHETKQISTLGFVISRLIGLEPSRGWITYYPKMDPAHILNLCWKIGASLDDDRVLELLNIVKNEQGEYGIWSCPIHPQASRWLTFDLLRTFSHLESSTEWFSTQPRIPFQEYTKKMKRF